MLENQRGATIIDSLVAIVILGVVLAASTSLFSFGTRVFSRETVRVGVHQDVAGAKNVVLDELSIANFRPEDLVAAGPFASAWPPPGGFREVSLSSALDSVDFWGDVNSDGLTDHVCYSVVSGELQRSVQAKGSNCGTGTVETLVTGVQAFELTFLQLDRTLAPLTRDNIVVDGLVPRYVQVTLTIGGPAKGGAVSQTERGETTLRN